MADYKEMYLKMMRASEDAIRILIKVQQECEELYLSAEEAEIISLPQNDSASHRGTHSLSRRDQPVRQSEKASL